MIQEEKTTPLPQGSVEVNMPENVAHPAYGDSDLERWTCCGVNQSKYVHLRCCCCCATRTTRKKAYIIGGVTLFLIAVALVLVYLFVFWAGPPYKQGDAFDKVVVGACAKVNVIFNASEFRVDTEPGTGCFIGQNWFGKLTAESTLDGTCCRALVQIPGANKVNRFESTSGSALRVWDARQNIDVSVTSGGGMVISEGEIPRITGSVTSGSALFIENNVEVDHIDVTTTSGGNVIRGTPDWAPDWDI